MNAETQLLLEKIKYEHVGEFNAITSRRLRSFGSGVEIRAMIHKLRVAGEPICSSGRGYYFPYSKAELGKTIDTLRERMESINEVYISMKETYKAMEKEEGADDEPRDLQHDGV